MQSVTLTQVESREDLECLVRGDAVTLIFQNHPGDKHGEIEYTAVYHGRYFENSVELVVAKGKREKFVTVYTQRIDTVQFRDGALVFDERHSSIQSYNKSHRDYEKFDETLRKAGVRY
ncbi:MAG: hypothetical protein ACMXYE_04425 [Candidatus Woesearchaeota archaeon]